MSKRVLGNDPFQRTTAKTHPRAKTAPNTTPTVTTQAPLDSPIAPLLAPEGTTVVSRPHGDSPPTASPKLFESKEIAPPWLAVLRRFFKTSTSNSLDAWGRDENLASLIRPIAEFLFQRYFHMEVFHADVLPQGPLIIVANHSAAPPLDGPLLHHALLSHRPDLKRSRWLLEDEYLDAAWLGTWFKRLGAVRATPDNVLSLLRAQHPVLVFPEGTRRVRPPVEEGARQLQPFGRGGYLKLAARASATVIPAALTAGEYRLPLWPRHLKLPMSALQELPLPSRWTIRFGEPVKLPQKETPEAFRDLNEQVRQTIEGLIQASKQTGNQPHT